MTRKRVMASSPKQARRKAKGPRTVVTKVNKIKEMGRVDKYSVTTRKKKHRKKRK